MDIATTLDGGLDFFGDVVRRVETDQWENPTPCESWNVRELTGHVVGVMQIAVRMMRGGELGGSLSPVALSDDPVADWEHAATSVREELASADLEAERDTVMGRQPVSSSLRFPALDLYLHGWDLARATGHDVRIPSDIAEWAHHLLQQMPPDRLRGPKTFGPEQPAPPDADATTRLMAFAGRSVS